MGGSNEMKMTYTAVYSSEGKPCVSIRFDRGNDYAEGLLPKAVITKSNGFSNEELEQLASYLEENSKEIKEKALEITGIKHWF